MRELQDIIRITRSHPGPLALATLVGVEGSSYRRPGSRLLFDTSGPLRGSLSGGCLEGDIEARAMEAIESRQARLVSYDLRGDADLVWGSGSGCEGQLKVLVEPLHGFPEWMGWIETSWSNRVPLTIQTDLSPERLGRRSNDWRADDPAATFSETILPVPELWIFGAGEDSRPLVHMAKELGWFVGVLDHRPAFARVERFPGADAVRSGHPEQLIPELALDARSAVVLMTHHYGKDLEALRLLLPRSLGYLGLMGSRKRSAKLLQDLGTEGIFAGAPFHSPIGLDLGANSPETIALAILAEAQAVLARGTGVPLRDAPHGPRK
ncbi:MAG TPA: XdhC family protein [Geothrix sp.]|nr:XdhC family protein [Geothrix sp.]